MLLFFCHFFEVVLFFHDFQIIGDQEAPGSSQSTQPLQEPASEPQQQLVEEQQRRQEAVVQKDRVSVTCTVCRWAIQFEQSKI